MSEDLSHLTKKQEEVLYFIRSYYEQEGRTPSYSEIQHHFGLKSKSSVQDYISYLKKAGFLQKSLGSRGIELIERKREVPMESIPLLGSVAAGKPLDVQRDESESELEEKSEKELEDDNEELDNVLEALTVVRARYSYTTITALSNVVRDVPTPPPNR